MNLPIMRKATAVWLVDNTHLSFQQIADFCGMHDLEIQGIADGEVAVGVKGFDPIVNNQLTLEEIERVSADPKARLVLKVIPNTEGERKRKGPRYTPLSKRQDKPAAIAWLVKNHPELTDGQIGNLVGTTKPTIQAIRTRSHWNINNIIPIDPVAVGLSSQIELDAAVAKSAPKVGTTEVLGEGDTIISTEESLSADQSAAQANLAELSNFSLSEPAEKEVDDFDPESVFKT